MWLSVLRRFSPRAFNSLDRSNGVLLNVALKNMVATSSVKASVKNKNGSEEETLAAKTSSEQFPESLDSSEKLDTDVSGKYKAFRDEDSVVIFDVVEERKKIEAIEAAEEVDEFAGISLKRGVTGVLDIAELVDVLKKQKAQDIFVISVPPEYRYVSMMVVVTGRSTRHLQAITEFVRKVYKRKKGSRDPFLKIEGESSNNWKALDLGNIALHIFLKSTREMYDLESLWSLGADYDNLCRKPDDPLISLLQNPFDLEGLEPASSSQA